MSLPLITILYNTAFYVYKFRINLIKDLKAQGFRVIVISPHDEYVETLEALGIEHQEIHMSQYGMNPVKEIATTIETYRVLKRLNPVCSLHYTIKPNIFGSIAASMAGVAVINNIAGAGRAFSDDKSIFSRFVSALYGFGLRRSRKVFFQNDDDKQLFLDHGLVQPSVAERIPGSGVDLEKYSVPDSFLDDGVFRFLFVGRLLKEKGIQEYCAAAEQILSTNDSSPIVFEIVGEIDDTSSCMDVDELNSYLVDPRFVYHGTFSPDEMPGLVGRVDCVVLPSYYREGVPRSLLEAAAMGKPIITTDNVGCREVVDEGINGFKVAVRDPTALQKAMQKMLDMSPERRRFMGLAGRRKVETEFDETFVLTAYRRAINEIVNLKN